MNEALKDDLIVFDQEGKQASDTLRRVSGRERDKSLYRQFSEGDLRRLNIVFGDRLVLSRSQKDRYFDKKLAEN